MSKIFSHPRIALFNGPAVPARPWFTVKNEANSDTAEILIYDQIGKDWWSGDGVGAKDFAESLKAIPATKNILVRINSPGGNVWDGLAIFHQLQARKQYVTCCVDGVAASIASIIALAGKELRMPRNSLFMIHDPTATAMGSAEDMRAAADMLDKHKDVLAGVYESKTGKPLKDIKDKMSEETWFTGDEAKEYGLADTVTDEIALSANFNLSSFRRVPAALGKPNPSAASRSEATPKDIMKRDEIIALLKEHGVEVANDIFDKDLQTKLKDVLAKIKGITASAVAAASIAASAANASPTAAPAAAPEIAAITNELKAMREQRDAEKKARITARVKELQPNRIPVNQVENWIKRAMNDEGVLEDLAALPVQNVGEEPVVAEITGDSVSDVQKHIVRNSHEIGQAFLQNKVKVDTMRDAAIAVANAYEKNRTKLLGVFNTNTIATELKRQVILQEVMRAYKRKIIQLSAFSTVFANVPLLGTNKINVPYFPLYTSASKDYVANDGYVFDKNTEIQAKEITVNKRKYQPFNFSSEELARQPYFDPTRLAALMAEQLGVDVFNDVLSVVTLANFGAAVKSEPAAAFDVNDVIDIADACDIAEWPETGRTLILDSTYCANLLKSEDVKHFDKSGSQDALRRGVVGNLAGFDIMKSTRIPSNDENLEGMAVHMSAIIVATSPIAPAPGVRSKLLRYELVVDPDTGIAFEYRYGADEWKDMDRETIEANYGYAVGESAALKRITSA
jgi:ATP-dependent Clp endopeptidase proteolytic subunit ClpP